MRGTRKFCQRGPTLTFYFCFLFFFDEGRKDSNTTISGPSTARQQNAIQMAFRWRADGGPILNAGLLALWFYRGSWLIMLRNPIFLWLGRDPLSPPLDPHVFMYLSICINPFIRNCVWKLKLKSIRGASTLVTRKDMALSAISMNSALADKEFVLS